MPTPNTIVVSGGGGGGGGDSYPSTFVGSAAELASALASLDGPGGIICLSADITITSALVVPQGVMILGRYGAQRLSMGAGGSLRLRAKSEIRDLTIVSAKTSGNLILMPEARALVRACYFRVNNANAVTCVYVTGSYNRIMQTTFTGVIGTGPAIGIDYAAGSENKDEDSFFE